MDQKDLWAEHNNAYTAFDLSTNRLLCNECIYIITPNDKSILPLWEIVRHTKKEFENSYNRFFKVYEKAKSYNRDRVIQHIAKELNDFIDEIDKVIENSKESVISKLQQSAHVSNAKEIITSNIEIKSNSIESKYVEKKMFDKLITDRKYLNIAKRANHFEKCINEVRKSHQEIENLVSNVKSEINGVLKLNYKEDLISQNINSIFTSMITVDEIPHLTSIDNIMKPCIDRSPIPLPPKPILHSPNSSHSFIESQHEVSLPLSPSRAVSRTSTISTSLIDLSSPSKFQIQSFSLFLYYTNSILY